MNFDIAKKNSLIGLPTFNKAKQKQVSSTPEIYGRFLKDQPRLIKLPYAGEVDLSQVTLRLLALTECFTAYDPQKNEYYVTQDENRGQEAHVCIMSANYQGKYMTFCITTRGALCNITAKMNNLNIGSLEKIAGSEIDGLAYIVTPCKVSLRMQNSRATGYSYLALDGCHVADLSQGEVTNFIEYIQSDDFKKTLASCMESNNEFLSVD